MGTAKVEAIRKKEWDSSTPGYSEQTVLMAWLSKLKEGRTVPQSWGDTGELSSQGRPFHSRKPPGYEMVREQEATAKSRKSTGECLSHMKTRPRYFFLNLQKQCFWLKAKIERVQLARA